MNEPENKQGYNFRVLGANLLIFAIYTVIGILSGGDGQLGAFFFSLFHFAVCVILAIVFRKWAWLLSALVILVIGLGTCVSNVNLGGMH